MYMLMACWWLSGEFRRRGIVLLVGGLELSLSLRRELAVGLEVPFRFLY